MEQKRIFNIGDIVIAINNKPLQGNDKAPKLDLNIDYTIVDECFDQLGNQHIDVGIESSLNYIRSFETKEELPNGNMIHWCHPSRFTKKQ